MLAVLGGPACDRKPADEHQDPPASRPARPAPPPPGEDAAGTARLVDPPAPPGNLAAELAQFTTLERCVESRAPLDPLVGDALDALGYDELVVDACRLLDAARAREAGRCEAIEASALRTRCQAVVAELSGSADDCPWQVAARPARGRDPTCVAVASRDPRLCAAAQDPLSRAACAAIVRDGAAACAPLSLPDDRARCTRDAERWGLLARGLPPGGEGKPVAPPAGTVSLEGGDAQAPQSVDLGSDLERGVVLVEQRDGTRMVLGALAETGPGFIVASPHVRARFWVELFVPRGARSSEAQVERVQLVLPGRPALATPTARSTLVAKIGALEPTRGGPVSVSLEGELGDAIASFRVHAQVSTFVRDVVKDGALPPPASSAGGASRGVR
jgi:hypothetical protein